MLDTTEFVPDPPIRCRDFRIGAIGAGFIMADVHLASYKQAGFPVAALASRTPANAKTVADRWGIPKVHASPKALIEDPDIEIVDVAFPPDLQPELIRHALQQKHVKAILAQKPLALDFAAAKALAAEAKAAGKVLSVNQNMRFDQSMRVLKQILDRELLGTPVLATIEMRAIPHWQPFLADYDRLTLLNMSIHHLDVLRQMPSRCAKVVRGSWRTIVITSVGSPSRKRTGAAGGIIRPADRTVGKVLRWI
jgi:predicted dehydrogenase